MDLYKLTYWSLYPQRLNGSFLSIFQAVGEPVGEVDKEIYKRFRLTEGADVEKSVDTTGHRI